MWAVESLAKGFKSHSREFISTIQNAPNFTNYEKGLFELCHGTLNISLEVFPSEYDISLEAILSAVGDKGHIPSVSSLQESLTHFTSARELLQDQEDLSKVHIDGTWRGPSLAECVT